MNSPRTAAVALFALASALAAQSPPATGVAPLPLRVGFAAESLELLLREAIRDGQAPGAVIHAHAQGAEIPTVVAGHAEVRPKKIPLTADAVFDCASLTKVVATATSVLRLVDQGRLRLDQPVTTWFKDFGTNGKDAITVEQLLRHRSGLIADNPLAHYQGTPDESRSKVFALGLEAPPGAKFIYSDVGYLVLGWIVEAVTGKPLETAAEELVFAPLGMKDSRYHREGAVLDAARLARCVPTEPEAAGGPPLRGVVHDPRARRLGGVAGHAGLFSTAEDLARFCRMILEQGLAADGSRFLAPETVRAMTTGGTTPDGERRGLGFDLETRFSSPRGALFSATSFGHTGFTGTSLWIDPECRAFVIVLASRLHPDGKGDVKELRRSAATIVAEAALGRRAPTLSGLDRIARGYWPPALAGRKVGFISNHSSVTKDGKRGIDILRARKDLTLVRLFSPEHGPKGVLDEKVGDAVDAESGLEIKSLYGATRKPTPEMLAGLEVIVFDVQDAGARFYTYVSTLVLAMEEAAKAKLAVVVLDRPNPIGGVAVEGPLADREALDFVGLLRMPIRHGLTVGEAARLAMQEKKLDLALHVIPCEGWTRDLYADEGELPWIAPSPNLRTVDAAILYPGIGLLETTNISVGRGTATPFEILGAPFIDGDALAADLAAKRLPGIVIEAARFTPDASTHRGAECGGLRLRITDRRALEPVRLGLEIASALRARYPKDWQLDRYDRLLKHRATLDALRLGDAVPAILQATAADREAYAARRRPLLLYPLPR